MEQQVVQTDVDRYVIVEYLAEGGMGAIFLGKKIGLGGFEKEVVLKQLLPEFTSQPEFIDLFLREAKLSAALDHANIVHTINLVKTGSDYFIVMEYVRGGDLRSILRRVKHRGAQVSPAACIFIAREILSALAYAHQKKSPEGVPLQLIHRDVSPANIMVSATGEVKLADFGIAKASTHKSVFYRVRGKIGYMSPEQAFGAQLDLRSDLYSLAVCLHEMLSGERLFVANLLSLPEEIYDQPVPALEGLRPGIPRGLDAVMRKSLAFKADDRYQTAHEFQEALVQVAFEAAMLFSAPELAAHLGEVCGQDASSWNKEPDEQDQARRGTEVLVDDAGAMLSGVELTSIFFGPPGTPGVEPAATGGADRRVETDPRGIAFEPTRLARSGVPEQALEFGDQDPTVAVDRLRPRDRQGEPGDQGPAPDAARPLPEPDNPPPAPAPAWSKRRPLAQRRRKRDPASVTDQMPPRPRPRERQRWVKLAAVALLFGAAGLIVALVGLTGPSLDEPGRGARKDPAPGTTASRPDATHAAVARDAGPKREAPDRRAGGRGRRGTKVDPEGMLRVISTPSGAAVYLDSVFQCKTPCAIEQLDQRGVHLLSVRRNRYVSWSALIDRRRSRSPVNAFLSEEPAPQRVGYVMIRSDPAAEVLVDGKEIGRVSSEGRIPLPPGRYTITLSHPQRRARPRYQVRVVARQTVVLRAKRF